ncbi:retrovirus-related pol polyprotein from transposon TNT 1-94 [Tanacetum coccineum]|uniref:Retrovirus-related pol polyprotein from transposon TNT 1-94 n=1 Tax=Tanacetum coccineum TaxID=301880 RepID=A0ABQ5HFX4_9ASTR
MSTQQDINAFRAQRLASTHDLLALMANTQTPFHPHQSSHITYLQHPQPNNNFVQQPSFNTSYMPQPMQNLEDSSDPTTAMNKALALMAKAFKLNSIPTNNNQRSSLIPHDSQIAQPDMNTSQDNKMQMVDDNVGNQVRQNAVQNDGNEVGKNTVQNLGIQNVENMNGLSVVPEIANQYGNGNVVTAPAKGNGNGINGNPIRCYNCRGKGHYASNCKVKSRKRDASYLQQQLQIAQEEEAGIQSTQKEFEFMTTADGHEEIERVNVNCTSDDTLQQASTSETQFDNAPVYDSDGSVEVSKDENCYDHDIFNMLTHEVQYTDLQTELEHTKEQFENSYNDMQQKIERLQAQLGDLKGKSYDTQCASNTLDLVSQKLKDKNLRAQLFDKVSEQVDTTKGTSTNTKFANQSTERKPSLQPVRKNLVVRQPNAFQSEHTTSSKNRVPQKVDETNDLSKPVTSNSVPTPQESKIVKHDNVIAPGMFRINPFKPSREEKYVPNKVRASVRTTPITVSQPHVVTKKDVNSDSNGLSSTGVDNTAKTRRPQPRSNTKNDRVPSASKSSCNKNKEVEVEEHHRNLLLSKNKKHMSSECKHVKLDTRNDQSEVICAMCKQCLITANHDVCMLNYVNDMNSRGKKQKANVSNTENQKKQKPKVKKPKKVGSNERLASPKPSKPRFCLRWSPTGRFFDIKGKIILKDAAKFVSRLPDLMRKESGMNPLANIRKHKPRVWKSKKVGSKERLASPKPSTPRSCLRWSPTGRMFDLKGKIIATSESECQRDCSKSDNAYCQKWHNGTSRGRSTKTSDGLVAIQAQLNNLGREIKKVNEKVYAAQVGCGGYRATAPGFYQRNNANPSYQERRQSMEDTLRKFMGESAKRHEENSNLIKEIRASTDAAIRNQGASIKTLEIQIRQMSKVLQERGFGSLPSSTETNSRDQVKSISTTIEVDSHRIRRIRSPKYAVSSGQNRTLIYETRQMTISFPSCLNSYYGDGKKGSYGPQFSEAYSKASHIDESIPQKEKDPGSFTLPCFINNVCFDNALVDLGASDCENPKGIAENVLVRIGKFTFPVEFIILDIPEDIKVPLFLGRPSLSTARAKIDVYKRKITLRVGEEKIIFKSVKPASSLIKRVYMLSLRERMELDLEARLMGETLVLNRSLDPFLEDYIKLNDLNEPFELRRNQGDDLMPTIKEGEVIEEFRTRDGDLDTGIDDYPSYCDDDKKIHIDCAHNLKFSCMIGFEFTHVNFFPLLYVNVMSKKFHNSIMKDKMVFKGDNVVGALMNVPIFVGTFSVVTDFAVLEDMDAYRDEGMSDVIVGEPFLREVGIKARRFDGMITIYNGDDEVTYQMVRSHPRFKHHTNEQCNKIPPLLKDLVKEISTNIGGEFRNLEILKPQDGCSTRNLAHKRKLDNLSSKYQGSFSF